jgi:hypothetical protein
MIGILTNFEILFVLLFNFSAFAFISLQKKASLSENRSRDEEEDEESDRENGDELPEFCEGDFVTLDEVNLLEFHLYFLNSLNLNNVAN